MLKWLYDKVYMFLLSRLNKKKYEVVRLRWEKARLEAALDKARQKADGQANSAD